jgi:hypothetical protein
VNPPFRLRVEFRNGEPLEKKHWATAARALPQGRRASVKPGRIWRTRPRHAQQLPAERQQDLALTVCQEAEEADADEAMWKHMEEKAAQKLFRSHCHELLLAAVRVVLPTKGDSIIGKGNNPMVGDGHPMCIASQVMKNVLRTSERRFRVHDPILTEQRTKEGTEGPVVRKWLKTTWKANCPFLKALFSPAVNLPRNTRLSTFTGRKNA